MSDIKDKDLAAFMKGVIRRNPGELEFHQAVQEVAIDIIPYIRDNERVKKMRILERMTEPDRIVSFRVVWEDDAGNVRVNRGYRIQQNNAIGPYKGGIRFHPTVTQSVLKFLAFEQVFKNSLTGLPLGGGKGGADFNPKGKSDREIMRFCQAFMTELSKYIGPNTDVPAGDIGVGGREVGYMFGQYKRLSEGANMPSDPEAIDIIKVSPIMHAPSKAANAGGVAVSGLEMSQNSLRMSWMREEVDTHLKKIINNIHSQCVAKGKCKDGSVDYFKGANIAGFNKVANAMLAYGAL